MGDPGLRWLYRAAKWLAWAYFLFWFILRIARSIVANEFEGLGGDLILGVPVIFWMALPVIVAAGFVMASSTRAGAVIFLAVEILLCASTPALFWYYRGEGVIIGLPLWPFVQFGMIILVFLIAIAGGWRMRPDFLKD